MKMKLLPIHLCFIAGIFLAFSCERDLPSSCKIISPEDGSEMYTGENNLIQVQAENSENLTEIRLFIDNDLKDVTQASQYVYEWNTEEEENGIHVIKAIALYEDGGYAMDEVRITLYSKEPPEISFFASKTIITEGDSVQFTDYSTNKPTEWLWDFGDGKSSMEHSPYHTYFASGAYTVTLTATNPYGSATGVKTNFVKVTGQFTDNRDGKTYRTIKIGDQVWTAENFAHLPGINLPGSGSLFEPRYYVHGYDGTSVGEAKASDKFRIFGVLYNWPAAKEVVPEGWHLPTDEEWKELEMFLGMEQAVADSFSFRGTNEGSKLADNAEVWDEGILENDEAFGSSGFIALPGGYRLLNNLIPVRFLGHGYEGYWWSSSEVGNDTTYAWIRQLACNYSNVRRSTEKKDLGFSIRLVKD